MPDITLQDGKKITFKESINGFEIAKKISKSLAKEACIMSVNGELRDLNFSIDKDVQVKIITQKDKEGLDVIIAYDQSISMAGHKIHTVREMVATLMKAMEKSAKIKVKAIGWSNSYKDGKQDLDKAIHFIDMIIERDYS